MASVTPAGIQRTSLSEYKNELETIFRSALGQDLDLSPETPQGQLIGLLAAAFSQQDDNLVAVSQGLSVSRGVGRQLDDLGSMLGIERIAASKSTVVATLSGRSGATIPAGSRARTEDGDSFETLADAEIAANGRVNANMQAVEAGPAQAAAGALSLIETPVAGWETVTNAAAASPGRAQETDAEFRIRYRLHVARNSISYAQAIDSRLREISGVVDIRIDSNDTEASVTRQQVAIPAHSFHVSHQGGDQTALNRAIAAVKPLGIGYSIAAVRLVALKIALTLRIDSRAFPAKGESLIKARLVNWVTGTWTDGDLRDFDRTGLAIGETVDQRRILDPVHSVPGHQVTAVDFQQQIGQASATALAAPRLNDRFTLAEDGVTITLT